MSNKEPTRFIEWLGTYGYAILAILICVMVLWHYRYFAIDHILPCLCNGTAIHSDGDNLLISRCLNATFFNGTCNRDIETFTVPTLLHTVVR